MHAPDDPDRLLAHGWTLLKHLEAAHEELVSNRAGEKGLGQAIAVELSAADRDLLMEMLERIEGEYADPDRRAALLACVPELARLLAERSDIASLWEPLVDFVDACGVSIGELVPGPGLYEAVPIVETTPWINKVLLRNKRIRKMYLQHWRMEVWGRLDWLSRTSVLPRQKMGRIRERVLRSVATIQAYSMWANMLGWIVFATRTPVLLAAAATLGVLEFAFAGDTWLGRLAAAGIGLAVYAVALVPMLFIVGLGRSTVIAAGLRRHQLVLACAAAAVAVLSLSGTSTTSPIPLALYVALTAHGSLAAAYVLADALAAAIWRWKTRRNPSEEIVNTFCWNLRFVEEETRSLLAPNSFGFFEPWPSTDFRRQVTRELNGIAGLLERETPRLLGTSDHHTDQWTRERAMKQAAAVRRFSRSALTGQEGARREIVRYLGRSLERACDELWISLDTGPPLAAGRARSFRETAATVLRALAPLLVVTLLRDHLHASVVDAMVPLSVGWLMTSALTAFGDPNASEKLEGSMKAGDHVSRSRGEAR